MHKTAHPNNRANSLRAKTIKPLPLRKIDYSPPAHGNSNEYELSLHTHDFFSARCAGAREVLSWNRMRPNEKLDSEEG
jgi:hypothetical protein